MAVVHKTLEEIKAHKPKINRAKILATTENDIRKHMREDEDDLDISAAALALSPKTLRLKHGMTQEQFAEALRIPVATLRNWEQGRVEPDPAAKSLMRVFAKNPKAVLGALA